MLKKLYLHFLFILFYNLEEEEKKELKILLIEDVSNFFNNIFEKNRKLIEIQVFDENFKIENDKLKLIRKNYSEEIIFEEKFPDFYLENYLKI